MAVLTSMTYLEAISEILTNVGLLPVNGISSNPDVDKAVRMLAMSSRQIQSEGWNFNTDRSLRISPDASAGNIILPLDTMAVDTVGQSAYINVTMRDNILLKTDNYDNTDPEVFSAAVYVDLIRYLEFERIPQPARYYITIKAARRFADSYLSSGTMHGFTLQEEQMARSALEEMEGADGKYNMLKTAPYIRRRVVNGGF